MKPKTSKKSKDSSEEGIFGLLEVFFLALLFVTVAFLMGTVARAEGSAPASAVRHRRPLVKAASQRPEEPVADSNIQLTTMNTHATLKERPSDFTYKGSLGIQTTRSLDRDSHTDYRGSFILTPSMTYVPWNVTASLVVMYMQEYVYERPDGAAGGFEDTRYTFKKAWKNGTDFRSPVFDELSVGISGLIPTSPVSINRSFHGSIGPRAGFVSKFGHLTATETFGYARSFYEYDMDANGNRLFADTYTNIFQLAYNFTEHFKLNGYFEYSYLVDYQQYTSGLQVVKMDLEYKWLKNFATALGVATIRSTIDQTQQTETFKFYEPESSVAYLTLILSV